MCWNKSVGRTSFFRACMRFLVFLSKADVVVGQVKECNNEDLFSLFFFFFSIISCSGVKQIILHFSMDETREQNLKKSYFYFFNKKYQLTLPSVLYST